MNLLSPYPTASDSSDVHPALRTLTDDWNAVMVRLMAYFSGLAVLSVIAVNLVTVVPAAPEPEMSMSQGWIPATRPHPAFAISKLDLNEQTDGYEILRHPEGGRRDILRWTSGVNGDARTAEIEIYRPGNELDGFSDPDADLAARMGRSRPASIEPAGLIGTKFGPVALFRISGASAAGQACLGFAKRFEVPRMRLSGWSCQNGTLAAHSATLGCTLDRLILLSAGNDPRMAELFAHAELRRRDCITTTPAKPVNWIVSAETPQLRGRMPN